MRLNFPSTSSTDYFGSFCSQEALKEAFRAVKRNKGAPGIDAIRVEDFEAKDLSKNNMDTFRRFAD